MAIRKIKLKMKNNIVIIFALVLFAGMVSSCTKDSETEEVSTKKTNNKEELSNSKVSVTITVSWDKWGTKKYGCKKGFGLCNFKISFESGDPEKSATVQFDKEGNNPFIEVLVDEFTVFNEGNHLFLIEDDLYTLDEEGTEYVLPAGEYELDESIGEMGGYTIPVQF